MKIRLPCFAVAASAIMFFSTSVFADPAKIRFCESCGSDGQFAQAGESAALSMIPVLTEGSQQILVINPATESMRMIKVTREMIGSSDGFGSDFWSTTSELTYLDPDLKTQALNAIQAVKSFKMEIQDEHARDMDFGVVPIDSAADLLGEGAGPDFVRDTFAQAVNNHITDGWLNQRKWDLAAFANRVANEFMGASVTSGSITVQFNDGTQIKLLLARTLEDPEGDISFELVVLTSTATGPGLMIIPSNLGAFLIAFGNEFSGNSDYLGNLGDLIVRGGGRVERSPTGDSCTGTLQCKDAGVDAKGNPRIECRLVLPKVELRC